MKPGSLRVRLIIAAALALAVALVIAGLVLTALFEQQFRGRVSRELANHMRQLVAALDITNNGSVTVAGELADPRFGSYASRKQHEDALLALVEPAVCARESHEIEAALMAAGLPCACVNNFEQVFDDPHMIERGIPSGMSSIRALGRCARCAIRFCSITTARRSSVMRRCWASTPRRS